MWAANLQLVFERNPQGQAYSSWVLFLRRGGGTAKETAIRKLHEKIDGILAEHNVTYAEITTQPGKAHAYRKFNFREGEHPIFLILNRPPLQYEKGDQLIVIEWGKWKDIDQLSDDVMALVSFFSDRAFVEELAKAKDPSAWRRMVAFFKMHGVALLGAGATVAGAVG